MPKQSRYTLHWSATGQQYELLANGQLQQRFSIDDHTAWQRWLEAHGSFAFQGQHGRLSAVKEHRARGAGYWYAYRSFGRRTAKRYLGPDASASIGRLEDVAQALARENQAAPPAEALPPASPAPLFSSALLLPKLLAPRLPAALVQRPRLLQQLDDSHRKLTLVTAPAGFGKTTVVRQWIEQRRSRSPELSVAWVSLDASDNDLIRFWRYVVAAFQTHDPAVGQATLRTLGSASPAPFVAPPTETALTLLLNDLTQRVPDGLLVLDDFHLVSEQRIHESVAFLIDRLPATLRIIVITRSEPPLPLLRWRAGGHLVELLAAQLRFTQEETGVFLRGALPTALSEAALRQLSASLEGWPAGLRLLTLTLGSQPSPGAIQDALVSLHNRSAPHRAIMDYFLTEILDSQPEPLQHFLLQTSMLSRLTAALCDAVTGSKNSAALLEEIQRSGLFLESLDGANTWYRYHALFAEALQSEATRRLGEAQLRRLALRASAWYEQHGLRAEAIETALLACAYSRAAQLIERSDEQGYIWESHTLRHWLHQLPEALLHAHPQLCLIFAITLRFPQGGQVEALLPDAVRSRIAALLELAVAGWKRQGKPSWDGVRHAFHALSALTEGPVTVSAEHAQKALEVLPHNDPDRRIFVWRSVCMGIVGGAKLYEGHLVEAQRLIREAHANSLTAGIPHFMREMRLSLGLSSYLLGELHQSHEHYRLALIEARDQDDREHIANALLGLARITYEWNDLETSEAQSNEVLALMRQQQHDLAEVAVVQLVALQHARGQAAAAQQLLAAQLARLPSAAPLFAVIVYPIALMWQGILLLEQGDSTAARRAWEPLLQPDATHPFHSHALAAILQARWLLAQGHLSDARSTLEQILVPVEAWRHTYTSMEIMVLLACANAAAQREQEAKDWLLRALVKAGPEGFLRVFLNEGEPVAQLLRALAPTIQDKAVRSFAQSILRAFALPVAATAARVLPGLLSPQEQRVLRLLAAGRTNQEIAHDLIISVNTVKDHVKHLYRKLGVGTRIDAADVARRLNLV